MENGGWANWAGADYASQSRVPAILAHACSMAQPLLLHLVVAGRVQAKAADLRSDACFRVSYILHASFCLRHQHAPQFLSRGPTPTCPKCAGRTSMKLYPMPLCCTALSRDRFGASFVWTKSELLVKVSALSMRSIPRLGETRPVKNSDCSTAA